MDPADASFDDRCEVVIQVGIAAHRYGATSVSLEEYLRRVPHPSSG